MLCPPLSPDPVVEDWIARHRRPVNFALHVLGIPATILGVLYIPIYLMLLSLPIFLLSFALFDGGFLIQFLGHGLDRTEPGEIAFLRRLLSRKPAAVRAERSPGRDAA